MIDLKLKKKKKKKKKLIILRRKKIHLSRLVKRPPGSKKTSDVKPGCQN